MNVGAPLSQQPLVPRLGMLTDQSASFPHPTQTRKEVIMVVLPIGFASGAYSRVRGNAAGAS